MILALLGWTCLAAAAVAQLARVVDVDQQAVILLASAAWGLSTLTVPGLLLLAIARSRAGIATAIALIVLVVVVYAPLFVAARAPAGAMSVRVMTLNMRLGSADVAHTVEIVRTQHIQLLALEELTPQARAALGRAGLNGLLPYSWAEPRPGASGSGLWSSYPLRSTAAYPQFDMATLSATVELPRGVDLEALVVHPGAPYPADPAVWFAELELLSQLFSGLPPGPALVLGDFNATWDSPRFRRLLVGGFRDAAEQAGGGVVRSWPADRAVPPAIGIDHVLTRGAVATSVRTVRVGGSDHLGLLGVVAVP